MRPLIEEKATVLFQGDSITDAGRDGRNLADLGRGYAALAAAWFEMLHPAKCVRFLNLGLSGNRSNDLRDRWQKDGIDLKPDWVSILIGINDTWRRFDSNVPMPAKDFEANLRDILAQTRDKLGAKLVLMEPFVLPVPEDRRAWREDLDPKIHIVRKLALEFGAILVPLDGIFAEASARREPAFWAGDGVHPTPAGHALIAHAWLKAVHAI